jgi:hypothetical protein
MEDREILPDLPGVGIFLSLIFLSKNPSTARPRKS